MQGEHLPPKYSQHPTFPHQAAGAQWVYSSALLYSLFVTQKMKVLKKRQSRKDRHRCLFTAESSPSSVLPIAKWYPTTRAVTLTSQRWQGRWLHPRQVRADKYSGTELQSTFLCQQWRQQYSSSSSGGERWDTRIGVIFVIFLGWLSQGEGEESLSVVLPAHKPPCPAPAQDWNREGLPLASARELTSAQIEPGLPSYFSINYLTVPCISLEYPAFYFL